MTEPWNQSDGESPFTRSSLARLLLSSEAWNLVEETRRQVPVHGRADAELVGDLARVRSQAEQVMALAVVAARESGTAWEAIGGALGVSRQEAHRKYRPAVDRWAERLDALPTGQAGEMAAWLDVWAVRHRESSDPQPVDEQHPVSGGLERMGPLDELLAVSRRRQWLHQQARDALVPAPPASLPADEQVVPAAVRAELLVLAERSALLFDRLADAGVTPDDNRAAAQRARAEAERLRRGAFYVAADDMPEGERPQRAFARRVSPEQAAQIVDQAAAGVPELDPVSTAAAAAGESRVSAAAVVLRLLSDLDDELVAALTRVEELLLVLAAWEDEPRTGEDLVPVDWPAPLAGRQALAVLGRLQDAVLPSQGERAVAAGWTGRLLGPDGRREHVPLRRVYVTQGDVEVLVAAVRALVGRSGDLAEAVDQAAEAHQVTADEMVGTAARIAALLDVPPTDAATIADIRRLVDLIAGVAPEADLVLDGDGEAAYQRLASRLNQIWADGDPTARWAY